MQSVLLQREKLRRYLWSAFGMLADSWKEAMQQTPLNCFCHASFTLDADTTASPRVDSVCDELPPTNVAFNDLPVAGVSIPAGIALEGFADAGKDPELCAELTDDETVHQVTKDSDGFGTNIEETTPTQPTSSEMTAALTLSSEYSDSMTLT